MTLGGIGETVLTEVVNQAARPLLGGVRQALARRGYAKTDFYTAIQETERDRSYEPSSLGLLRHLPRGVTDRDVREVISSPEFRQIARILVAAELSYQIDVTDHAQLQIRELLAATFPSADRIELDEYGKELGHQTLNQARAVAERIQGRLQKPGESLVWAYSQIAASYLQSVTKSLNNLAELELTSTLSQLPVWKDRYRASFTAHHSEIEVPDLLNRRRVQYEQLFVDCRILPFSDSATKLASLLPGRNNADKATFLPLIDRTVLLGDPGAGKSTTSGLIALSAFSEDTMIPFVLTMKDVRFESGGFSVVDQIELVLRTRYQCPASKQLIHQLLIDGSALLVFDGLDELLDGRDRRTAVSVIEVFGSLYPLSKILVTSRRVGYSSAALQSAIFDEFLVEGFNRDQVQQYITKWFRLQKKIEPADVDGLVRDLMDTSETIQDLRSSPLLLAFICILYRGHRHIPRRRPELYRRCVELVLAEWDKARGITSEVPEFDLYEVVLTRLAYSSLTAPGMAQGFTEDDVYQLGVPALLEEQVPDDRAATQIITDLLTVCRGRAWIFSDVGLDEDGRDLFSFTHASFQEYFAARHISRSSKSPEDMADMLLPQLAAGKWGVLAQISLTLGSAKTVAGGSRSVIRMLDYVEERVKLRAIARRRGVMQVSGRDISAIQTDAAYEADVAVVEFLLRSSDILAVSADALSRIVDLSFEQLADSGTPALIAILEPGYRYNDAARRRIQSLLDRALIEAIDAPENGVDPARAWIAAHFQYVTRLPGAQHVSTDAVQAIASEVKIPDGNWSRVAGLSGHWWAVALHLGRLDALSVIPGDGRMCSAEKTYLNLFTEPGRRLCNLGAASSVAWILDCLRVRSTPPRSRRSAIGILRWLGQHLDMQAVLEIGAPPAMDLYVYDLPDFAATTKRLLGYGRDVMRGWTLLMSGFLELHGLVAQKPVHEIALEAGVAELFGSRSTAGQLGLVTSDWISGRVGIWTQTDFGVS